MRSLFVLCAVLAVPGSSRADAIGPHQRGLRYHFEVVNLEAFPQHAFILYPTSNSGYGYVLEDGLPLAGVMMGQRRSGPTRLVVMTRDALRRHDPTAERLPQADDGRDVLVVDEPPEDAPVAAADIHPPGTVDLDDPRWSLTRRFRIARVTASALELELVEEITQMRDGTSRIRTGSGEERTEPAPPDWVAPELPRPFGGGLTPLPRSTTAVEEAPADLEPTEGASPEEADPVGEDVEAPAAPAAASGCGACAAAPRAGGGLGTLGLLLTIWVGRRARSSRRA